MDNRNTIVTAVASFVVAFMATMAVSKAVSGTSTELFVAQAPAAVASRVAPYAVNRQAAMAQPQQFATAMQATVDPGADIEWVQDDVTDLIAEDSEHLEFAVFMATKIRLTRLGRKKAPFYRVVVQDSRRQRDGRFIENIGTFDPLKKYDDPDRINLDVERVLYWLEQGAQPTDTVAHVLMQLGLKLPDWLVIRMQTFKDGKSLSIKQSLEAKAAAAAAAASEE